jgi:hypothetical protein
MRAECCTSIKTRPSGPRHRVHFTAPTNPHFHALGKTDDNRRLHITFTARSDGTLIRVISARDMHRKERRIYGDRQIQGPHAAADKARKVAPGKNGSSIQK